MLTRRKFLKSAMTTLVLIPIVGCGSDDSTGTGNDTGGGCDGAASTSSTAAGHVHTLCVPTSDLTSPPSSGRTYTTSLDAGHTHSVTLSQAQLQTINTGGGVTVDTTGGNHTHTFMIEKETQVRANGAHSVRMG